MKTLNIVGVIGDFWDGITEQDVIKELDGYDGELEVVINSPGGFAYDGIAIYNRIKSYEPTVKIVGLAASAASVIAMAGKEVHMLTGAEMMIHNAWGGVIGNSKDIAKYAEHLDKLSGSIADIYAVKTGDRDAAKKWMDDETWFTAEEAKQHGFATHIEGGDIEKPPHMEAALAAMGSIRTDWMESSKRQEFQLSAATAIAKQKWQRWKLQKRNTLV